MSLQEIFISASSLPYNNNKISEVVHKMLNLEMKNMMYELSV